MTVSLVPVNKECLQMGRYMIMIRIVVPKECQKLTVEGRGGQEEPKA